jgi:ribose 5-phosphate isomerase A
LGIPLTTWADHREIDLTIDGADEIESGTLNLIKGHGGALLREKIVASATKRFVIIADETKLVDRLGQHTTIPVEVVPFGWELAARRLHDLGTAATLRLADNEQPFVSDGGHYIVDCAFPAERSTEFLADALDRLVGVVEHGLFLGITSEAHVATSTGLRVLLPKRSSPTS